MQPAATDVPGGGHLPRQRYAKFAGEWTSGRGAHGGQQNVCEWATCPSSSKMREKAGRTSEAGILIPDKNKKYPSRHAPVL